MQQHSRQNKGHRYILIVINCFSKYVWAAPLKSKSAKGVAAAIGSILESVRRSPNHLQTDQGKEFFNSDLKRLMSKFGIQGNFKWIHLLQNDVSTYNNTKHQTIKMALVDVTDKTPLDYPRDVNGIRAKPRFNVDDVVRISSHKEFFEKRYEGNWSPAQLIVSDVKKTMPSTFLLKDEKGAKIDGCFYEEEMQKVRHPGVFLIEKVLQRKGYKSHVKWWGIPERNWVPTKDVNV